VQINFGVILNESLADAVKITVIATGFQPENAPLPDRRGVSEVRLQPRLPEPAAIAPPPPAPVPPPAAPPIMEPRIAPEPDLMLEPEPMLDLDDVETPAYLRQGRLLN
jgi:hypothetical protein